MLLNYCLLAMPSWIELVNLANVELFLQLCCIESFVDGHPGLSLK